MIRTAVRERSIDAVCLDFASVGDHIFVADDLFWHHPPRSLALAMIGLRNAGALFRRLASAGPCADGRSVPGA